MKHFTLEIEAEEKENNRNIKNKIPRKNSFNTSRTDWTNFSFKIGHSCLYLHKIMGFVTKLSKNKNHNRNDIKWLKW